ncbi:pseudouridine-5'-phosphatase-like [Mercenaria mercenaria]|uniref:pseudouridine-5'-phosphatase-like n=1 Tax=Mercenaria mercenaria TaxID=6596 RepID=UPI00234F5BC8|nr:pseudouridine-5'-phosphatase-like [Mercenaria mercenaria]
MDGLLLDTETLYTEASTTVCSEYGKTYTWDIKKHLMGQKEAVSARMIIDKLELPLTVEEYLTKIHVHHERLFPNVPFLPGAEKLVRHLHSHRVPIAVVTGSATHGFELKTRKHKDFFSLFHHIVLSGDDPEVIHGKPHPDAFEVGAKRFADSPDHAKILVFEDAINGVTAAHAAGMPCVWVPHPRQDKSILAEKTELIIDSLEEFQPEMFGLPPYDT